MTEIIRGQRGERTRRTTAPRRTITIPDLGPWEPTFGGNFGRRPRRWPWLLAALVLVGVAVGGTLAFRRMTEPTLASSFDAPPPPPASPAGPILTAPTEIMPTEPGFISTLRGLTTGAVSLTANGQPVELDAGGGYQLYLLPEWTEVTLTATDAVGNQSQAYVSVTATPAPAEHPITTAVHVRSHDWDDPVIHQQVLDLIAAGQINAVQLDIKGEGGDVGYASTVPMAVAAGAVTGAYDARATLDELHGLGVRVIGRIVNFLDPTLASWALENGRTDMIAQDASGAPLANNYGPAAFANFANPEVRQYQIDLAKEAVSLGFDEILFDYVRRPEGDMATMQFPGLIGPPDVSVARFVADAKAAIGDTPLGLSVFGISASRPEPTAQDMALLAPLVDYISPMVYPSLWTNGEYGVPDPEGMPGEIVSASLADFAKVTAGSGAAMVPWLQDFNSYGPPQIRAQIDAAYSVGSVGFIMWNALSTYVVDGIPAR
ncbi:putative glycoside hydrolase [soil metagenome]